MEMIYKKFVNETITEDGRLEKISYNVPDNFNFAFDIVDEWARVQPDRKAMVWVGNDETERIFTFSDISRLSNKVANMLVSRGVKKGDKVMLVLRRHYEFWLAVIALHKIGAVVIPATDQLKQKDFEYRFSAAGVTGIICTTDGEVLQEAELALKTYGDMKLKMTRYGGFEGWEDFSRYEEYSDVFERPQGEEGTVKDDLMLMYFTSGTTAYPKIAAHDYTYAIAHYTTARWWHNVDPDGIHFTVSDTGWGKAAWGKLYGQWTLGACIFTFDFDKFDQHRTLKMIEKYRITTFCAPPTIYRFMIKADLSHYDLSSLKYITTAGEALNSEVFNQMKKATGLSLMEGFGQTETTLTVANLIGTTPKPGSMGLPNPQYDVVLLDSDGNPTPRGEVGEICIDLKNGKPLGLFAGYYRGEEQTAEAFRGGVYHTGDMAWQDEDGYFWYVGRTDDLIKSSGYRIGPFEIESVLMQHPAVLECAVTGAPDEIRGQVVKATIVLTKGYSPSDELKKEIQEFVKNATAPYKYPRIIDFVTELPKTISGKIKRTELRKKDYNN